MRGTYETLEDVFVDVLDDKLKQELYEDYETARALGERRHFMGKTNISGMKFETEVGEGELEVENEEVTVKFHPKQEVAQLLASVFVDMMREVPGAKNYLEFVLNDARDGQVVVVTIRYAEGETPAAKATRMKKAAEEALNLCEGLVEFALDECGTRYKSCGDQLEIKRLRREIER